MYISPHERQQALFPHARSGHVPAGRVNKYRQRSDLLTRLTLTSGFQEIPYRHPLLQSYL